VSDLPGVHGRPVCLGVATPPAREEVVKESPAPGGRELEHNDLLMRGVRPSEVRIARASPALGIQQSGKGFLHLHVAEA
jgi:hypothetical protein